MLRLRSTARFFSAVNVRYKSQNVVGLHVSFRHQTTSRGLSSSSDEPKGSHSHVSNATRSRVPDQNLEVLEKRAKSLGHDEGLEATSLYKPVQAIQEVEFYNKSDNCTETKYSQFATPEYYIDIAYKFSAPGTSHKLKELSPSIASLLNTKPAPLFPVFSHVLSVSETVKYLQRSLPRYARHQTNFSVSVRELPTALSPDSFAVAYGLQNTTQSRQHSDIKIDFLWPMSTNQGFWSLRTGGRREMFWNPELPTTRGSAPQNQARGGVRPKKIEAGSLDMEVTAICYWIRHIDDTSEPKWIELPFLGEKPKPVVREPVDGVENTELEDDAARKSEYGIASEEPATEYSGAPSTNLWRPPTRYERRQAYFAIEDEKRRLEFLGQPVKVKTIREMTRVMMKLSDESEALKAQRIEEEMRDREYPPLKSLNLGHSHALKSETSSVSRTAAGSEAQYTAEITDPTSGSDDYESTGNPKDSESISMGLRNGADFQRKLQQERGRLLWGKHVLKSASRLDGAREAIEQRIGRSIPEKTVDLGDDNAVHLDELISTDDIDASQPGMPLAMSKGSSPAPTDKTPPSSNPATGSKRSATLSLDLPIIPPRPSQDSPSTTSSSLPRTNYEYQRMLSARMAQASRLSDSKPPTVAPEVQPSVAWSNFTSSLVNPYRYYQSVVLTRDMVKKPEYSKRSVKLDDYDFFGGNDAAESFKSALWPAPEPNVRKDELTDVEVNSQANNQDGSENAQSDSPESTSVSTASRQLDSPVSLVSNVEPITESISQVDESSVASQATSRDVFSDKKANNLSTTKSEIPEQGLEQEKLDLAQNDKQDSYTTTETPGTTKLEPASDYYEIPFVRPSPGPNPNNGVSTPHLTHAHPRTQEQQHEGASQDLKPKTEPEPEDPPSEALSFRRYTSLTSRLDLGLYTYAEQLEFARAERDLGDGLGPRPRISYFPSRKSDPAAEFPSDIRRRVKENLDARLVDFSPNARRAGSGISYEDTADSMSADYMPAIGNMDSDPPQDIPKTTPLQVPASTYSPALAPDSAESTTKGPRPPTGAEQKQARIAAKKEKKEAKKEEKEAKKRVAAAKKEKKIKDEVQRVEKRERLYQKPLEMEAKEKARLERLAVGNGKEEREGLGISDSLDDGKGEQETTPPVTSHRGEAEREKEIFLEGLQEETAKTTQHKK